MLYVLVALLPISDKYFTFNDRCNKLAHKFSIIFPLCTKFAVISRVGFILCGNLYITYSAHLRGPMAPNQLGGLLIEQDSELKQ